MAFSYNACKKAVRYFFLNVQKYYSVDLLTWCFRLGIKENALECETLERTMELFDIVHFCSEFVHGHLPSELTKCEIVYVTLYSNFCDIIIMLIRIYQIEECNKCIFESKNYFCKIVWNCQFSWYNTFTLCVSDCQIKNNEMWFQKYIYHQQVQKYNTYEQTFVSCILKTHVQDSWSCIDPVWDKCFTISTQFHPRGFSPLLSVWFHCLRFCAFVSCSFFGFFDISSCKSILKSVRH